MQYSEPQPNKIKIYAKWSMVILAIIGIFLVMILLLLDVKKKSRDTISLSNISQLRSDISLYFLKYSRFPESILYGTNLDQDKCFKNLCLSQRYLDPKTNQEYIYIPCETKGNENCNPGIIDPQGYMLYYSLETPTNAASPGQHFATQSKTCADPNCK